VRWVPLNDPDGKYRAAAALRRASRFIRFIDQIPRPVRIVDLGGAAEMWRRWGVTDAHQLRVTLINNHQIDTSHLNEALPGRFVDERRQDVLDLTEADLAEFDVVFSNSMLEHLSSRAEQTRLASVIAGSGRPFFIQVPNKNCIVDPHYPHPFAPFFAVLPKAVQARMLTLHALGSGTRAANMQDALRRVQFYTPIGRRDLARLFPGSTIDTERLMGLPLSLIARFDGWNASHGGNPRPQRPA